MSSEPVSEGAFPELSIQVEHVCFIVVKAREFDAKGRADDSPTQVQMLPTTGCIPFSKTIPMIRSSRN